MDELPVSWGLSSKTEATLVVREANNLIAFLFTFSLDKQRIMVSWAVNPTPSASTKKIPKKVGRRGQK